jgi:hypothetical protein
MQKVIVGAVLLAVLAVTGTAMAKGPVVSGPNTKGPVVSGPRK